jgi:hypothetical protein
MFLLNESFLAVGPLQGQQFRTVKLGLTSALAEEWQIVGEYTFMIKADETHGYLHTFSTTA